MTKSKNMPKLKENPTDIVYCEYCRVLFESDPEVEVSKMDLSSLIRSFTITVSELNKFLVISKFLNGMHEYGSTKWFIDVKLAENYKVVDPKGKKPVEMLFRGNPNFERMIRVEGALTDIDVVVLKPVIVQPEVDDWSNPDGGIRSYTYEQMVDKIFGVIPQTTYTTSSLKKNSKKR